MQFVEMRNTLVEVTDFALWISQELERRGWSRSEAARRGGISSSSLDKVIGGFANPGLDFFRGIARAFSMPLEDVLRKAGVLPELNVDAIDWDRVRNLSPEDQEFFLTHMEQFLDFLERKTRRR